MLAMSTPLAERTVWPAASTGVKNRIAQSASERTAAKAFIGTSSVANRWVFCGRPGLYQAKSLHPTWLSEQG
jgi:hypothetical protein